MASPDVVNDPDSSPLDGFLRSYLAGGQGQRRKKTRARQTNDFSGALIEKLTLSLFEVPPGVLTFRADELKSRLALQGGHDTSILSPLGSGEIVRADSNPMKRGLTCIRCTLRFDERASQLSHFKSELHLTNLRRQLVGEPPLSQEEMDIMNARKTTVESVTGDTTFGSVEDGEGDPDAGTDSSADEPGVDTTDAAEGSAALGAGDMDDAEGEDGVVPSAKAVAELTQTTLQATAAGTRIRGGQVKVEYTLEEGPRLLFTPSGSSWSFSLSSAALAMERGSDPWERLDWLLGDGSAEDDGNTCALASTAANRLWAVLIVRSGRFAAAVFEGQSVLCHKVFRRYTIRAKRGGSQSSHDSGGRKAQSAGATLRRYGEQSLREDARALMKEWEGPLKACRVILTSVPKSMRAILFDGKDAPFERKDPRLRPVPFAVGKPVFEEVIAVHGRVTSIVFTPSVPDLSNRLGEDSSGEAVKGTDAVTGVPRQGKKESGRAEDEHRQGEKERSGGGGPSSFGEVESCPPSRELIVACERGDAEAAAALLDRLAVSGGDPDGSEADGARVLSTAGAEEDALEEARGNWTAAEVINRPDGLERVMTPLHVAAAEGHSPVIEVLLERGASPLAEDVRGRLPYMMAQKKDARDAFRRARAAQPDRWDWDAARVPEPLTDELVQRQKEKQKEKEKEKRKRAKQRKKEEKANAEAQERDRKAKEEAAAQARRARGLAPVGHCDGCGKVLDEKNAFRRLEFRYCSTECVNAHRRKLAADAAERRLGGAGGGGT